jgi:single-stranded-DNA-specific exonuclease
MELREDEWLQYLSSAGLKNTTVQKEIFLKVFDRIEYRSSINNISKLGRDQLSYQAFRYLFPQYNLLSSPFAIPGFYQGIELFKDILSIKSNQPKIVIFGDRDADGVCSSAILALFLKNICNYPEEKVHLLYPLSEDKYGINEEVATRIIAESPQVLVALDCGSANKLQFQMIQEKLPSLKSVILDHHFLPEKEEDYPKVHSFINPKTLSTDKPMRDCCTAALTWFFIWGITYSFTKDFKKVRLIQGKYEADGVLIDNPAEFSSDIEEFSDLSNYWNQIIKKSPDLYKIKRFLEAHPETLSDWEKFHVIRLSSMHRLQKISSAFLPLAAMGTVADLVPLLDENRILLSQGLSYIQSNKPSCSIGFDLLIKKYQIQPAFFNEEDFSFYLCPAVNAAGRIKDSGAAIDALLEKDPLSAAENVHRLYELNLTRKEETRKATNLMEAQKPLNSEACDLLAFYHKDIHKGISGLLASKLAEKHERPICVLVDDGDSIRGSLRAWQNENVFGIFQFIGSLLIQFGGHRQAAGFSLPKEQLNDFIKKLNNISYDFLGQTENDHERKINEFFPPLSINESELKNQLFHDTLSFAPFGKSNPRPVISIKTTKEIEIQKIGQEKNHLKLNSNLFSSSNSEAVWFFYEKDSLNKLQNHEKVLTMEPQYNFFRGKRTNQFKVKKVDII